jgi:Transmembrane secretion effector
MRLPARARPPPASRPLAHAAEGFRFVAGAAPVRAILLFLAFVTIAGMPYAVLMPIFAAGVLHAGARGLGLLMAAAGLGALGGALALASRDSVHGLWRWIDGAFGVALGLFWLSRASGWRPSSSAGCSRAANRRRRRARPRRPRHQRMRDEGERAVVDEERAHEGRLATPPPGNRRHRRHFFFV